MRAKAGRYPLSFRNYSAACGRRPSGRGGRGAMRVGAALSAALCMAMVLACCLCPGAVHASSPSVSFVRDGVSDWRIDLGPHPSPQAELAAEELVHYVRSVTGGTLPVVTSQDAPGGRVILIGSPDDHPALAGQSSVLGLTEAALGEQGYVVQVDESRIVLGGSRPVGALYATYRFIEDALGVRWIWPGEDGEVVPSRPDVTLAAGRTASRPAFVLRTFLLVSASPYSDAARRAVQWLARRRMNDCRPPLSVLMRHASRPGSEATDVLDYMCRRGFKIPSGGHSFSHWMSEKKYFADHPEYFGWELRRRVPMSERVHPCVTNPDVTEVFLSEIESLLDRMGEIRVDLVGVTPGDFSQWCRCAECSKVGSDTGLYFGFLNGLAERLAVSRPGQRLWGFGYSTYREPPDFPVHRNIHVRYYCYARDYAGPMATAPGSALDRRRILGWLKAVDSLYVAEYYASMGPRDGTVVPMAHVTAETLRTYHRIGVKGFGSEVVPYAPGNAWMGVDWRGKKFWNYALTQLLWDPAQDFEAIKRDFFSSYFGPGGEGLQAAYQALEDAWQGFEGSIGWKWGASLCAQLLSEKELHEMLALVDQACERTAADPVYGPRVRREAEGYRLWRKHWRKYTVAGSGDGGN